MSDERPPRPADAPAGFDEEDPYEGVDLAEFPEWWRENVCEFREHRMRPYRPPEFADGVLVPELVDQVETDLDVELRISKHIGADAEESWKVLVDGEAVTEIDRIRNEEGRSVYSVTGETFEQLIRDSVDD